MAHFLIADNELKVRLTLLSLIKPQGHTYKECENIIDTIEAAKIGESEGGKPFDLILLNRDFGEALGLNVIKGLTTIMGTEYCEHRIVITDNQQRGLSAEFEAIKVVGQLHKPIKEAQFWIAINAALARKQLHLSEKISPNSANNLSIFETIKILKTVTQQYVILDAIHQDLLNDLQVAGQQDSQIALAYNKATYQISALVIELQQLAPGNTLDYNF